MDTEDKILFGGACFLVLIIIIIGIINGLIYLWSENKVCKTYFPDLNRLACIITDTKAISTNNLKLIEVKK